MRDYSQKCYCIKKNFSTSAEAFVTCKLDRNQNEVHEANGEIHPDGLQNRIKKY
jgi:hypothetical protein